ncbi:MAG: hypothetical protein ACOCRX_01860 [Candidatus Woesearchaeota archaeon]
MKKEDIVSWTIEEIAGEEAVDIVFFLLENPDFSEFKLADLKNINIKDLRNIMYDLMEHDLLKWRRKKDRQKGWYIYFWTIKQENFPYLYRKFKKKKLEKIKRRIDEEENNEFFMCPNYCLRVSYEKAMDIHFSCPECGSILKPQDNTKTKKLLKSHLEKIKKDLKEFKQDKENMDFSVIEVDYSKKRKTTSGEYNSKRKKKESKKKSKSKSDNQKKSSKKISKKDKKKEDKKEKKSKKPSKKSKKNKKSSKEKSSKKKNLDKKSSKDSSNSKKKSSKSKK